MARRPTKEEIAAYYAWFLENFPRPPTFQLLGCTGLKVDIETGSAEAVFTATEAMFNPGRRIQGGFLTAMMDDTMGPLINIMSAGQQLPSSTDLHSQFHRPAAPGPLTCKAKTIRMGAQICTSSAELYGGHGKMIASCIHTAVLLPFATPKT